MLAVGDDERQPPGRGTVSQCRERFSHGEADADRGLPDGRRGRRPGARRQFGDRRVRRESRADDGGITDIRTLGRKFVTAVNSGDAATAKSLGCPDYDLTTADAMVEDGRQLRITSVSDDEKEPSAELVATHSDGDRSEYAINAVRDAAAGDLCIDGLIYHIPDEG
ncbi:hypothetical protein LY13_002253 [Prauserella aidingensis]|uniref:hypothetical protein n=1 Tax=Prauserella aidingensis TaxID=387890 RepID=UPI0020A24B18|nr:hypothetical protein [Prauserella aidingensis]MCP2253500.1 hypothetical protein [Prauserella aidingensis]